MTDTTFDHVSLVPFHEWHGKEALLKNIDSILDAVIRKAEKEWAVTLTREVAIATLEKMGREEKPFGLYASVLNDSHLLIWSFAAPWYAGDQRWITEQFFLRIGKGATKDAFTAIDLLARNIGATGVVMATSLARNDAALGRLLAGQGYQPMSSQHFKSYT